MRSKSRQPIILRGQRASGRSPFVHDISRERELQLLSCTTQPDEAVCAGTSWTGAGQVASKGISRYHCSGRNEQNKLKGGWALTHCVKTISL
jgi:hypothetical protein